MACRIVIVAVLLMISIPGCAMSASLDMEREVLHVGHDGLALTVSLRSPRFEFDESVVGGTPPLRTSGDLTEEREARGRLSDYHGR